MKEDLILIPEVDVFKTLIADARKDLAEVESEDQETKDRCELAKEITNVLEEKVQGIQDIKKLDTKDRIWLASHLYFLEVVLEDIFVDEEDMFFFEDEEEIIEEDDEEEK